MKREKIEWRNIDHWHGRAVVAEKRLRAVEAVVAAQREALRLIASGEYFGIAEDIAREVLGAEGVSEPRARTEQIVPESASAESGGSLTSPVDTARCGVCGHPVGRHSSGGMCAGEPPDGSECYCVLFPDSPDCIGSEPAAPEEPT